MTTQKQLKQTNTSWKIVSDQQYNLKGRKQYLTSMFRQQWVQVLPVCIYRYRYNVIIVTINRNNNIDADDYNT